MKFLDQEPNEFNPLYYYLAAIRQMLDEIRYLLQKANSKKGAKVHEPKKQLTDYLIKFVPTDPKQEKKRAETKKKELDPKVLAQRKKFIFGAIGLSPTGKVKTPRKNIRNPRVPKKRKAKC